MARKSKQASNEPVAPPVDFTAAGATPEARQANVITARQSPAFFLVAELIADALTKRAETVLLDYTREAVGMRFQIDGVWHTLPARDRESGDAMLAVLKKIADLDIAERRARQEGEFKVEFYKTKNVIKLTTQGIKTGERVLLSITHKGEPLETLEDLGMRPGMRDKLKEYLEASQGLILFSSISEGGLETTWNASLNTADRLMRDFIALEDQDNLGPEVINVAQHTYNTAAGETPATILPRLMLKEPDVVIVPELNDAKSSDALFDVVNNVKRLVILRIRAKDSVEALLRVLMLKGSAKAFAEAVTVVFNQRLVRRLCTTCRQAYKPQPQLLQKLGIPQGRVDTLYREYQPPPPEQLVDDKGRPIPPPVCADCNALGYKGRIAVYEMLVIDDPIRKALAKQPKLDVIRNLARQGGWRTIQEEGILQVASGVTSLAELQRALKQ